MREAVMNSGLFVAPAAEQEREAQRERVLRLEPWNLDDFRAEQIRGLVRQVFLAPASHSTRQVVFTAADRDTHIGEFCLLVGEMLAEESGKCVLIVGEEVQSDPNAAYSFARSSVRESGESGRQPAPVQFKHNVWRTSLDSNSRSTAALQSYLGEVRTSFEYSIFSAPSAAVSNAITGMAQFADGVVLVLSADRTRRIAARTVKEKLEAAGACLFGVVLLDRVFPIPERIYRRL